METISEIISNSLWVGLLGGGIVIIIGILLIPLYSRRAKAKRTVAEKKSTARREQDALPQGGSASRVAAFRLVDKKSGKSLAIDSLPVTIGRASDSDVVLQDGTVSLQHANIYFDASLQAVCIEDIGSENGIYINGYPTCRNTLQERDLITIGDRDLEFHQGASGQQEEQLEIKGSE